MGKNPNQIDEIPEHWSRDRKIESLLPLARILAGRWRVRKDTTSLDGDDLFSIACQAVIRSVDEYNSARKVTLVAYTKKRIRWALQEAVRTYSHAPRTMVTEGKTVSWIYFSHDTSANGKSLGEVISDVFPDEANPGPEEIYAHKQDRERFYQYIERLPVKHRAALEYYLQHNCTQREVAAHIGVSESRVLQLIKGATESMRKMLAEDQESFESALLGAGYEALS